MPSRPPWRFFVIFFFYFHLFAFYAARPAAYEGTLANGRATWVLMSTKAPPRTPCYVQLRPFLVLTCVWWKATSREMNLAFTQGQSRRPDLSEGSVASDPGPPRVVAPGSTRTAGRPWVDPRSVVRSANGFTHPMVAHIRWSLRIWPECTQVRLGLDAQAGRGAAAPVLALRRRRPTRPRSVQLHAARRRGARRRRSS